MVFRTFGKDIKQITWEFNKFCSGQHPCYSGRNGTPLIKFDGSKGTKDFRIKDEMQKGLMYRTTDDIVDAKLIVGTFERESNDLDEMRDILDSNEKYEDAEVKEDPLAIFQTILETLKKSASMSI